MNPAEENAMERAWCEYPYNQKEMSKLNGIIIDGIAYEAVRRGSYHCSDCDLRKQCEAHPILFNSLCLCDFWGERIIFKTYRH